MAFKNKHTKKPTKHRGPRPFVAYCRVSTERQADQGQSLDAQWEAIKKAGGEGRVVMGPYTDAGISGGRIKGRRALKAACQTAAREKGIVVVQSLSRLARNLGDLLRIVRWLNKRGAGLISLQESIETHTPSGRMMMAMIGAVAEFEREQVSSRTAAVHQHLRNQGMRGNGGHPPYGFNIVAKKRLEPNHEELKVCIRIRMLQDDGWSCRAIAEALNKDNVPTKLRNGPWSPLSVWKLMRRDWSRWPTLPAIYGILLKPLRADRESNAAHPAEQQAQEPPHTPPAEDHPTEQTAPAQ